MCLYKLISFPGATNIPLWKLKKYPDINFSCTCLHTSVSNMAKTRDRSRKGHQSQSEEELKRRWDEKAKRILSHSKVQKPRQRGFRSKTVVRSLPASQRPWAAGLEESEGKQATLISEKYVARDDDDVVLAAYYPRYLSATIVAQVSKSLLNFAGAYPPPRPSERDLRHTDWKSLCNLCGGTKSVGLYHLCTWFEQGHLTKPPCLSADTRRGSRNFEAVLKFIKALELLTFCLSILYRVLNPILGPSQSKSSRTHANVISPLKIYDRASGKPGRADPFSPICQPIRTAISQIGKMD
jgi:hypothetical protein